MIKKRKPRPDMVGNKFRQKHGHCPKGARTRVYKSWCSMNERCHVERTAKYHLYGGRGIVVCDRWRASFINFLEDMGEPPTDKHTIDRIDGKLGYFKENCRWATYKEQNRNTTRNRFLTLGDETYCVNEWAEKIGIHKSTLKSRLANGWSIEKALTTPLLVSLLLFFLPVIAFAEPFKLNFGNDWFAPGGQDRWLTNQFDIHYGDWGIGNEMYTPLNKSRPTLPIGDRPFDGYSYLEHVDTTKVAFGEENVLVKRIGALGHASGTDSLQQYVHDDLGLGAHPTWAGQNPSEAAFDVIYFRRNREYLQSVIGDSRMTTEYGIRAGNVVDEVFLDQELTKHFFKHMYFFGGVRAAAVAFNTHLDGRMFKDNVYTIDKNWFVCEGRLGVDMRYDGWFVGYTWKYLTEEFKGQDGRHLMGNIHFGFEF